MRRLAFQIYMTVVGVLLLFAVLVSLTWIVHPQAPWERDFAHELGAVVAEILPSPNRPTEELRAALERLATRLQIDVAVFDSVAARLAAMGEPLPDTPRRRRGWLRHQARATTVTLPLPYGRTFVARRMHPPGEAPQPSSCSSASWGWRWRSERGLSCAASRGASSGASSGCGSGWRTSAVAI